MYKCINCIMFFKLTKCTNCMFRLVQMCSNLSKHVQTCPNVYSVPIVSNVLIVSNESIVQIFQAWKVSTLRSVPIVSNVKTCSDLSKHVQTCLNVCRLVQTCSNLSKPEVENYFMWYWLNCTKFMTLSYSILDTQKNDTHAYNVIS